MWAKRVAGSLFEDNCQIGRAHSCIAVITADVSDSAQHSQPYDDKPARATGEYNLDDPSLTPALGAPSGKVRPILSWTTTAVIVSTSY
jgi:hypothetical protein